MGPFSYGQVMTDRQLGKEWWHQEAAGGGSMLDYCCYGTILSNWYLGEKPLGVYGLKANFNHRFGDAEDYASLMVRYPEAVSILEKVKDTFEYPVYWGCDLQSEHERYLTEKVYKKPVFLTDYPKEIKAFYMRLNDDKKTVAAADLLVPGIGELIGGSQREEREDVLIAKMKEMNIDPADYKWYLDLRRYGGTVHSGFGLGFERMIMYLTGIANIRDVLPFPRTVSNLEY